MVPFIFKTCKSELNIRNNKPLIGAYISIAFIVITCFMDIYYASLFFMFMGIVLSLLARRKIQNQTYYPISFDEDCLIIEDETSQKKQIFYNDIQRINIYFKGIKGDVVAPMRGPIIGNGNKIKIIMNSKGKVTRFILCETDADFLRLRLFGRFLKEIGVTVKMSGFG